MQFFRPEGIHKNLISLVFILKILAGIVMFFLYTFYYTDRSTADIFKYFDDGMVMFSALKENPEDYFRMLSGIGNDSPQFEIYYQKMNNWYRVYESNIYNDSHTIIRFNAFVRLFSFGYYNVHTVFMCFFSFTGLMAVYKFLKHYINGKGTLLFVMIFLMPSVLFWSSGVLKEGILFFGLGILLLSVHHILRKEKIWFSLLCILFALPLLYFTKLYILLTIFPLIIAFVWVEKTKKKLVFLKYFASCLVFYAIGFNLHYILPEYNALQIIYIKQRDFIGLANFVESGSLIEIGRLEPTFKSLLINAPIGFWNTLVRPHIFEIFNPFITMAALENLLLWLLLLLPVFFRNRTEKDKNIMFLCLFFVVITYTLTGLITPVMGAIVRYKTPALPFLIALIFILTDQRIFLKTKSLFPQKG